MDYEKTTAKIYRTFFEASGIHHSNSGFRVTHDTYIHSYFMFLSDVTPKSCGSVDHTSHPENGNLRVVLKFGKPLPEAITCLLYLEFDNSVLIDFSRNVTTDFE